MFKFSFNKTPKKDSTTFCFSFRFAVFICKIISANKITNVISCSVPVCVSVCMLKLLPHTYVCLSVRTYMCKYGTVLYTFEYLHITVFRALFLNKSVKKRYKILQEIYIHMYMYKNCCTQPPVLRPLNILLRET